MNRSSPPLSLSRVNGHAPSRLVLRGGLLVVCAVGSADIAQFLVGGWASLAPHPSRLGGSILGLALWLLLMFGALLGLRNGALRGIRVGMVCLAAVLALGSVALVPIHLAAGAGGGRAVVGALLALVALALACAQGRAEPGPVGVPSSRS